MISLDNEEIALAILEMRDLLRLLAEPAVAARDLKVRQELIRIVGSSKPKADAVFAMDGTRNQAAIHRETGIQKSHLSVLVKQLGDAGLLVTRSEHPKLAITIPQSFFLERSA